MKKIKIFIIVLLCLISTIMSGQPCKLTKCDYRSLSEQMFRYFYTAPSDSNFFKNENPYINEYVTIKNMISGDEIIKDDEIPYKGILGATPNTVHPAHTCLIIKCGNDCEVLYIDNTSEEYFGDFSYHLYHQVSQAYEFFKYHKQEMDGDDFPAYVKIICDVFIDNHKYLE